MKIIIATDQDITTVGHRGIRIAKGCIDRNRGNSKGSMGQWLVFCGQIEQDTPPRNLIFAKISTTLI
jgi:hypothetical protein